MTGSHDPPARPVQAPAVPAPRAAADRQRMLSLLRAQHTFPGLFYFSFVAQNLEQVHISVRAAVEADLLTPIAEGHWETRASGKGRFVSHRVHIHVRDAEHVLDIYARVQSVPGILTVM